MLQDDIRTRLQAALFAYKARADAADYQLVQSMLAQASTQAGLLASGASDEPLLHHLLATAQSLLTEQPVVPDFPGIALRTTTAEGDLLGDKKFEAFDIGWAESVIHWVDHLGPNGRFVYPPGNAPVVDIDDTVTIALVGDWGTGTNWRTDGHAVPAKNVADAVKARLPDITIHLGDVYYSGTQIEETQNFLEPWPRGRSSSFALNSNHDMYSGANGYFDVTLKSECFRKQGGFSHFALRNAKWLIIALDSAYYANALGLYMEGNLDKGQLDFVRNMVAGANGRQIILLTHHNGLSLDGTTQQPLWTQIAPIVSQCNVWWYWGHMHAAVLYVPHGKLRARCCGHGAIPVGAPTVLQRTANAVWFETRLANDPAYPARILNGFALLALKGDTLTETFVDELGGEAAQATC